MRVMTYNVRRSLGADGAYSPRRIAAVIAALRPDFAGLQEVWRVPRVADQPARFAEGSGMEAVFQVTVSQVGTEFGNVALTRHPLRESRRVELPGRRQRRGLIVLDACIDGRDIAFGATHLSLHRETRRLQMEAMLTEMPDDRPAVIVGDFNCTTAELEPLLDRFRHVDPHPTFPAERPFRAIDHVLYSHHLRLTGAHTVPTLASDHLPFVVDLAFEEEGADEARSASAWDDGV